MSNRKGEQPPETGTRPMSAIKNSDHKRMAISVALCTYNGAPHLREHLESIQAQIRPPDELVVCDDRSADNTLEIIKDFSLQSPFPVHCHINDKNLGTTKNFDRVIGLATGDIIALADQDDVWDKEKLRLIETSFLSSYRIGVVLTDAEIVDERLSPLGYTLWQFLNFTHSFPPARHRALAALLKRNPAFGTTMAFRVQFKELILPIPPDVGHDMWIALLITVVAELGLIAQPLVKYRQHPGQQSVERPLRTGVRNKLSRAKADGREVIIRNARLYEQAYQRISTQAQGKDHEEALRLLQQKLTHLRTRSSLPREKLRRLPVALKEFAALRYHRYSNGSLSLAKDLLLL